MTPSNGEPASLERQSWIEIVGITVIVPLSIYLFNSRDPFLLNAGFPWISLIPLLMGAQHGMRGAVASAALLSSGAWLLGGGSGSLAQWCAGSLAAGLVGGYCRDRMRTRLAHLGLLVEEHAARLARLSRAHGVLRLSHQRLEERLSAQSWSLAAAVNEAERRISSCETPADAAQVALDVFFNHAMVQSASLLLRPIAARANSDDDAPLGLLAQSGPARSVDAGHPLIQRSLATGRLVAIDGHADTHTDPSVLAAVPLSAASGRKLGVLVVHEMPFMALQAAHLKNLAALALYIGDLIADHRAPERAAPEPFDGTRTGTRVRDGAARSAGAC